MSPINLPENLQTERLELKQVSVQWLEEIFAENKGNVSRYFYKFELLGDLQTWINENRREQKDGRKLEMVILNSDSKEFLGMVSLQKLNIFPELGIWIKESAQGKGYAKEAVLNLINWYKLNFGPEEKIRYLAENTNFASISLARSLRIEEKGEVVNADGVAFQEFMI